MALATFAFASLTIATVALGQGASSNAVTAYTPSVGACPKGFELVRSAGTVGNQSLGPDEASYISKRKTQVLPDAWKTYVQNVQSKDLDLPSYVSSILGGGANISDLPSLGIAVSGGGFRAAIFGAGVLNALDGRNESSKTAGTGGLLQASLYLTGLSGGSWLVSSFAQAEFPTFQEVIFGIPGGSNSSEYSGWNIEFNAFLPHDNTTLDIPYLQGVINETRGKFDAGFPVTFVDLWGRCIARHFVNGTDSNNIFTTITDLHGAGVTYSSLANLSSIINHQVPLPILLADSHSASDNQSNIISALGDDIPLSNVLFEFSPFEMGSYDPTLSAFVPTKFLGTMNTSTCVTGFDQVSFITGTSSDEYNIFNTSLSALLSSGVGPIFALLNESLPENDNTVELDVAMYPNPFFGLANDTFNLSKERYLGLVDAGDDGQVIPLQPLLVEARNVDVIIAIDATNDIDDFAFGSSLIATQNRTSSFFSSAYSFPSVPMNISTFQAQNLSSRPTFFGCNESAPTPLLIYIANGAPPPGESAITNTTSGQATYAPVDVQAMLDQTFTIATQGRPAPSTDANASATSDPEWPACLACAVVDRVRAGLGTERSGVCADCFSRYCWDPTIGAIAQQPTPSTSSAQSFGLSYAGSTIILWVALSSFVSLLLL
ncbi:hypothetical protein SCHPADRAFT_819403 [Schizopora paradoxa]|uniref:Lysophospholipase n=1 Tax=Schizopora paradoxa TaxID=27342 RepID=A0A0H2S358_9AGAM|nr:hypothetical protein SCHPADRAFT_819403 [Schizopora paradoxa]